MKVSISKYLGFTDKEVRDIFKEEEELLLREREEIDRKQKKHILVVRN